ERGHEREADRDDEPDREQERHGRGCPTALQAVALEPVARRVEREREKRRDQDPGQDVPRDPDDLQGNRDGDHGRQQRQDRPKPEPDQALRDHRPIVAERSDVYVFPRASNLPRVSLNGRPIEQTASLPDGRVVHVRIGIPEDSYIPRRLLRTVDVELFTADEHLAAVNSVLLPEQESEARALARRIVAGLESGELEPTAGAIEPLAGHPPPRWR